jgi:hypothetical protein
MIGEEKIRMSVVKHQFSVARCVGYWEMYNVSDNIVVAILRVKMYWSINVGRLGQGVDQPIHADHDSRNRNITETLDNSQYSTPLRSKSRKFSLKAIRENVSSRVTVLTT